MISRMDLTLVIAIVVGCVVGSLSGLMVDNARSFGAVGAMVGLVVGCSLSVLPPRTR